MTILSVLSDSQRNNIVSLPYRVGIWVSESDAGGGDHSDEREIQALTNILNGFAEEVFGAETVQHIISETLNRQSEWPDWAKNLGAIEEDCRTAMDVLYHKMDEKEVKAFKQHLIEIGEAVALAFREYDASQTMLNKMPVYIAYYIGKTKASMQKTSYKSLDQFLNISPKERKTLTALARSLDMTYA